MSKLDRLVWAASSTYHIGPLHLGIRTDSEWLDGVLRSALADYHVPGVEAPANFSVVIPRSAETAPATGLNLLYEKHTNLVRSRYPERALLGLFQHLAQYLPVESPGLLRVSAMALVRDDRAILVPRLVINWLEQLAPRFNRSGWQFVDHPWSALDLETAELVVAPSPLVVDDSWRDELNGRQSKREPAAVSPGRYPVVGWGVFSADEQKMSRAAGAAAAAQTVLNPHEFGVRDAMNGLLALTERMRFTGLGSPYEGDLPTRIMQLDEATS